MQNAWNKYGKENFVFLIIEKCHKSTLNQAEKFWINFLDTFNNGYNLTKGGEVSHMLFEVNREKLSKSQTGVKNHNFGKSDSGIAFVYKSKDNRVQNGYVWVYKRTINKEKIKISSVSLKTLEQKVRKKNLSWTIIDKNKAQQSYS